MVSSAKTFLGPLFGRNLVTVSFRHGRDLGPGNVNMATGRAICAFFEEQNNLSTDLDPHYPGELASKCETWPKASISRGIEIVLWLQT